MMCRRGGGFVPCDRMVVCRIIRRRSATDRGCCMQRQRFGCCHSPCVSVREMLVFTGSRTGILRTILRCGRLQPLFAAKKRTNIKITYLLDIQTHSKIKNIVLLGFNMVIVWSISNNSRQRGCAFGMTIRVLRIKKTPD